MNYPTNRLSPEPANPQNTPDGPQSQNRKRNISAQLLIQQLRGKIRRIETTARNDDGTIVSSGCVDIDSLLPAGGYNRGTIVEWLADPGSGAEFLSLLVAKHAAENGGAIVVLDPHRQFHPPAARALGINLGNLIVLTGIKEVSPQLPERPAGCCAPLVPDPFNTPEDFYWSIDQSLRCNAVAAVWGALPDFETPQIATCWLRRFQLSAESSGCLGLFTRKLKGSGTICRNGQQVAAHSRCLTSLTSTLISWSEIQWHVQSLAGDSDSRRVRTALVRCRGGTVGRSIDLEINTITGNVQQARREHDNRNRLAAS